MDDIKQIKRERLHWDSDDDKILRKEWEKKRWGDGVWLQKSSDLAKALTTVILELPN